MPTLVVVTGPPASGKSTIADALARRARLPLIAKDPIKEILFDSFGWSDRAWSRKVGIGTYPLLYAAAEAILRSGRSLVLEANFANEWSRDHLADLPPNRFVQVHCTASDDVLLERYAARLRDGSRHPGHGGAEILDELRETLRTKRDGPLDLPGLRFDVVTDRFEDVRLGDIEAAMPPPTDTDARPALVVVTGPPASGKTSIAKRLAEELKLPFISKDTMKERLYETFGSGDNLEDTVEHAALSILFSVVASNLAAGVSVLAESNFDAESDVQPFRDLCKRFDVRIVQVHMDRDIDKLTKKFVKRVEQGTRHPGHGDEPEDAEEVRAKVEAGFWSALEIPGALIEADADESRDAVVRRVRAVLDGG